MKEIKLDCFSKNQACEIISAAKSFEVNNPFEQQFVLEINNHSSQNCEFILEIKNLIANDLLNMNNLALGDGEKLLFEGGLKKFLQQKNNLGFINANSVKKYFFDFNFLNLAFENQKIQANFDLLLNFHCQENQVIQIKDSSQVAAMSTGVVLGASKTNASGLIYLALTLCAFSFFVIMKFIHGKKKKSQR